MEKSKETFRPTSIFLLPEEKTEVRKRAAQEMRTISNFCRIAIKQFLSEKNKMEESQ